MRKIFFLIVALCLVLPLYCRAQENKGSLIAESQYFSVYAHDTIDVYTVITKLNVDYLVFGDAFAQKNGDDLKGMLASTLDNLYQEVSDILDIHIYSFKGTIEIVADQASLAGLLKSQFNLDFNERSIYCHEKNIIYISAADMNTGMLGREIAHAIISQFFVVPPPTKVQEVLAGYVESSLREEHVSQVQTP